MLSSNWEQISILEQVLGEIIYKKRIVWKINVINSGEIVNNSFSVYGENSKFYWIVYGKRLEINNIEPNKDDVSVKGSGPYLWI